MSDNTWKYLPILNACLKIFSTVGLGAVLGHTKVFEHAFVPYAVKFVFHVALPCLVVKGIGVGVDFYSDLFLWKYFAAFLILRAIALVFAVTSLLLPRNRARVGIGDIAVRWLCLSWISTVILGVPILTAVMNDARKGELYGIFAGISSFVFQLPLQLFFLECHSAEQQKLENMTGDLCDDGPNFPTATIANGDDPRVATETTNHSPVDRSLAVEKGLFRSNHSQSRDSSSDFATDGIRNDGWALLDSLSKSKDLWRRVALQVLRNPVLWGILFGFLISLSTFGVKYLRPKMENGEPNESYVEGLQWLVSTLAWFGATVSPLSLFAMGVWMQEQGHKLFHIGIIQLTLFMVSKLILLPAIMVGLAFACGLNEMDDEPARAAVLIAALPISMASFSLGEKYNKGEDLLSANVAIGTVLMLPILLAWNVVMDEIGLFDNFVVKRK